jgi:hypothetical protein
MTQPASDAPYRCPTPCDDDCEINGWGCHEAHGERKRWQHDPEACEALMLAGNLRSLWDADWEVEVFKMWPAADPLTPWRCRLRHDRRHVQGFTATGPGDALAKAVEWSRQEGYAP